MSWARVFGIIWCLSLAVWAQDFPVEVDLVPPAAAAAPSAIVLPPAKPEPRWQPLPVLCGMCKDTALPGRCSCALPVDREWALRTWTELRQEAMQVLELQLPATVELQCVTSARLRQLGGEELLGLAEPGHIWLSFDLDRRRGYAVLAHEAGHLWQFERRSESDRWPAEFQEGFAEWVAYRLLSHRQAHRQASEMLGQTSVYGRGLRRFLKLERHQGRAKVLEVASRPQADGW